MSSVYIFGERMPSLTGNNAWGGSQQYTLADGTIVKIDIENSELSFSSTGSTSRTGKITSSGISLEAATALGIINKIDVGSGSIVSTTTNTQGVINSRSVIGASSARFDLIGADGSTTRSVTLSNMGVNLPNVTVTNDNFTPNLGQIKSIVSNYVQNGGTGELSSLSITDSLTSSGVTNLTGDTYVTGAIHLGDTATGQPVVFSGEATVDAEGKLKLLFDPTEPEDAVQKNYVDNSLASFVQYDTTLTEGQYQALTEEQKQSKIYITSN